MYLYCEGRGLGVKHLVEIQLALVMSVFEKSPHRDARFSPLHIILKIEQGEE